MPKRARDDGSKPDPPKKSQIVRLRGARDLRARLVLATLSRKPVEISGIRARDERPGLRKEEASFVRLLDKLTSGSRIEIDETGATLRYSPGFLAGGRVEHDCFRSGRPVGWFLDAILPLAPFGRLALELTLTGATSSDRGARSADAVKHCALPLLAKFGVGGGLEVDILRREAPVRPENRTEGWLRAAADAAQRGRVVFRCPAARCLEPQLLEGADAVKRVRGVAYCTRAAPALANRCVAAARGPLNKVLADVRITTDAAAKRDCAPAPGFGCLLLAETLSGLVFGAELDAHWWRGEDGAPPEPEALGEKAALVLLGEVARKGMCDDAGQPLVVTLMALCPEEASRVVLGPLTDRCAARLRLIRTFLGVTFKLRQRDDATVRAACMGSGFANVSKPVT